MLLWTFLYMFLSWTRDNISLGWTCRVWIAKLCRLCKCYSLMPTCFPKCLDEIILLSEKCKCVLFPTLITVHVLNFSQSVGCKYSQWDLLFCWPALYIFSYPGTHENDAFLAFFCSKLQLGFSGLGWAGSDWHGGSEHSSPRVDMLRTELINFSFG